MNKSAINDKAVEFIVKRAFRAGVVTRIDVVNAFAISPATASRMMAEALARRGNLLERNGQKVAPRLLAEAPPYASEASLLETLDAGGNDLLLRVGLYSHELPLVYVCWTRSMPRKPGILSTLIAAIRNEGFLRIVYLPMRLKEAPQRRLIAPLGLERMNDQWRVVAQDLEKENCPIRVFVLARILEAEKEALKRRPPGFVLQHLSDAQVAVAVSLNPKLTPLQQAVVAAELGIREGKVRLAQRGIFEFKRRFSSEPATPDAVWPLLEDCREM